MKVAARLVWVFLAAGFSQLAIAQGTTDDQADVWAIVEAQWNAEEKGDKKWIDRLLADDFSGWPTSSPAPRNKASTKMWDRYSDTQGKMTAHELYPLAIIVSGDTAVAHYMYTSAFEDKDGKSELNNGRYTDVLVRKGGTWKFLAWHGGDSGTAGGAD